MFLACLVLPSTLAADPSDWTYAIEYRASRSAKPVLIARSTALKYGIDPPLKGRPVVRARSGWFTAPLSAHPDELLRTFRKGAKLEVIRTLPFCKGLVSSTATSYSFGNVTVTSSHIRRSGGLTVLAVHFGWKWRTIQFGCR